MKFSRRIKLTLLLVLAALLLPDGAARGDFEYDFASQSLDEVLSLYMDAHSLSEKNFSMAWHDLTTGDEWLFNADEFKVVASIYKLPLNMAYTDMLASGEVSADDQLPGYTVDGAMKLSIIYSDNRAAHKLIAALGLSQHDYGMLLARHSGMDESELPREFFSGSKMSARFVLNNLVYLYENSDFYSELIERMKAANPGQYFRLGNDGYEIAHKYGAINSILNDCGIVYTPRPFALVVLTHGLGRPEIVLSELCAIMTDYSLYLDSLPEPTPEPEPEPAPEPAPAPEAEAVPEPEPEPVSPGARHSSAPFSLWAGCAAVLAALPALALIRKRKRQIT